MRENWGVLECVQVASVWGFPWAGSTKGSSQGYLDCEVAN